MKEDHMVVFSLAFAVMGGDKNKLIGLISNDLDKYLLALILCMLSSKKELFYSLLNSRAGTTSLTACDKAVPRFVVDAGGLTRNRQLPSDMLLLLAKEAEGGATDVRSLVAMVQECMPQRC